MGEGIGVVWPGATTQAFMGLPSGRPIQFKDEDADLLARPHPGDRGPVREYSRRSPSPSGTKTVNARVRGVDPEFGELRNIIPSPAAAS